MLARGMFVLAKRYCCSLPARRGICYSNVAGWLGSWVSVRHSPVLYQNGKTYLKTFSTIW